MTVEGRLSIVDASTPGTLAYLNHKNHKNHAAYAERLAADECNHPKVHVATH
jgi:hypothetical protein